MFCNKCGAKVTEGSLFCPSCGGKIEYSSKADTGKAEEPEKTTARKETVTVSRESEKAHNFGIASMVLGICGIFIPFLVPAILAIVFGSVSARHNGGKKNGFAMAGFVLGWVSLAVSIVVIVLCVVFSVAMIQAMIPGGFFGS